MKRYWPAFCIVFLLGVAAGLVVAWYIVHTLPALPFLPNVTSFGVV